MSYLQYTQADVDRLRVSVQRFGFGFLPDAIAPSVLPRLQSEAQDCFASSVAAKRSESVRYRARIGSLGVLGQSLLFGSPMIDLLHSVSSEQLEAAEQMSCVTFYQEGDFLGLHRDQPAAECVMTAIVYLAASTPSVNSEQTGLTLRIYGQDPACPTPRLSIATVISTLVIGYGSKYWHERPMLEKGESVTALTGCYRPAA